MQFWNKFNEENVFKWTLNVYGMILGKAVPWIKNTEVKYHQKSLGYSYTAFFFGTFLLLK